MYTIGVTGGVGAGKSEVLNYLERRWGAVVVRLDDVSRSLLEPGREEYFSARELFGEEAVLEDGRLDRGKIAEMIFSDEEKRKQLDDIIHPAVKRETLRLIKKYSGEGVKLFVIEAALLIEDHYDAICSELWYIYAGETTRYSRLAASRGYSGERIRSMMARQMSDAEFRANTDFTVDNGGSFADTCAAVDRRIGEITGKERPEEGRA